jgi:hypothetical protein
MQRNVTDTGWETKTVSGKSLNLVTDSQGGLSLNTTPTPRQWSPFSVLGDTTTYSISSSAAYIDMGGTHTATASIVLEANTNESLVAVRNNSVTAKKIIVEAESGEFTLESNWIRTMKLYQTNIITTDSNTSGHYMMIAATGESQPN